MALAPPEELDELAVDALQFLSATIKCKHEVEAIAKLSDKQLLALINESVKTSRNSEKAALAAHNWAVTFRRVASLLTAKDSEALLSSARQQAHKVRTELVATKSVISSGELTEALGISRQALSKAVLANRIFAVEVGGENYYPTFYADPDLDRKKLERISKILGELDGWSRWQFFTTPKASLEGLTPIQALKKGRYENVATAAAGFAER